MTFWREWFNPIRNDISMFAIDLSKGEHFDLYQDFQVGDLDKEEIGFPNMLFDAAIGSHVLEHLNDPQKFIENLFGKMLPGGCVYLEVPTPKTKLLPTNTEMAARNVPVMISNFFDDGTHLDTFDLDVLAGWALHSGFSIEAMGFVRQPFLEDQLLEYGIEHGDGEVLLYGYWLATSWAQYIILRRPFPHDGLPNRVKKLVTDEWSNNLP